MKIFIILLLMAHPLYAEDVIAIFDMPDNSGYNLVSYQANAERQVNMDVVAIVSENDDVVSLVLSGTFKVDGDYVALINGDSFRKNAEISGYRIIDIDINSTTLLKKGEKVTIYVENN